MSHTPAFRQLQAFIAEETARKPRKKRRPKQETTNSLTSRVIKHIRDAGGSAFRINTTGIYDQKLGKYRPSGSTNGTPDILACVQGRFCGLEIKVGADKMSHEQQAVARDIESSLGYFLEVRSFEQFLAWWEEKTRPRFV